MSTSCRSTDSPRSGFDVDDAAVRKAQAEVLDQRAAVAERLGGADGAADAIRCGDREHFLGRQVRDEPDAVAARRRPAHPHVRRRQPDGQVGPGAVNTQRACTASGSGSRCAPPARRCAAARRRPDRADRGGTGARCVLRSSCEPLIRGLVRKHFRRPRRRRPSAITDQLVWLREMSSRNGDHAARRRLLERAGQIGRLVLQQIGVVGIDRQDGVAGLRMLGERFGQPGRELTERVAPRVAEPRELQRLVAPDRFDQFGAGTIGAGGDLADERRRLERHAAVHQRTDDQQPLPRLQVERDPDGELAVRLELLLVTIYGRHNR